MDKASDLPEGQETRAVGYLRASTASQRLGPEAQREAIVRYGARSCIRVVAWFEDLGVSGGAALDKRPGLVAAIDALQSEGATVLLVAKRDRLARDVLTAAMVERLCQRAGARILSADGAGNETTPEAELMRRIIDAFAAYERALIRSRTRAALQAKKARGERVGGVPYGYTVGPDGRLLVPHPKEQAALAMARRLRAEGKSLRKIGEALAASGHTPRSGGRWHVQVVSRICE